MGLTWKQKFSKKSAKEQYEFFENCGLKIVCQRVSPPYDLIQGALRHCNKLNFEHKSPLCARSSEDITPHHPIRFFYISGDEKGIQIKDYRNWSAFYKDWKFVSYDK